MGYPPVSLLYFGRVAVLKSAPRVEGSGWIMGRYASNFLREVESRVCGCLSKCDVSFSMLLKRVPLIGFSGRIYSEFLGAFRCPEFPLVEVRVYSPGVVSVWVKVVSYLSDLDVLSRVWATFCRKVAKPFVSRVFGGDGFLRGIGMPGVLRFQGFCTTFYSFVHLIGGQSLKATSGKVLYCLVNPLGCQSVSEEYIVKNLHVESGKYAGDRFAYYQTGILFQMAGFRGKRNKITRRRVREMYKLSADLALAAQAFYGGISKPDFDNDTLYKSLLWLSPHFWSSDFYVRRRSFLSAYRRIAKGIKLDEYFNRYRRFLTLFSDLKVRKTIEEINSTALKLRIEPPIPRFPAGRGLSGVSRVLVECLIYKHLIEESLIPEGKVGKALFKLLYGEDVSSYEANIRKFNATYMRRKRKVGLCVTELSVSTGKSKATLYEFINHVHEYTRGMLMVDEDTLGNRKVKVLRVNTEHQDVRNLLWIYNSRVREIVRRLR